MRSSPKWDWVLLSPHKAMQVDFVMLLSVSLFWNLNLYLLCLLLSRIWYKPNIWTSEKIQRPCLHWHDALKGGIWGNKYSGNVPDGKLFSKAGKISSMRKIHFPKKHKTIKRSPYNIITFNKQNYRRFKIGPKYFPLINTVKVYITSLRIKMRLHSFIY